MLVFASFLLPFSTCYILYANSIQATTFWLPCHLKCCARREDDIVCSGIKRLHDQGDLRIVKPSHNALCLINGPKWRQYKDGKRNCQLVKVNILKFVCSQPIENNLHFLLKTSNLSTPHPPFFFARERLTVFAMERGIRKWAICLLRDLALLRMTKQVTFPHPHPFFSEENA